ncbi:lipid-binding SYLF domain-containing protein [uncultured Thiodictyon sp.]|uniref:lipid-binding SYLF domain-containing protein n=1 Tax=uncultured Thiodictyon sp. TaxID=1846217 RepID=UPI0025E0C191|nr:lipid-binding SYLF domain-containing protein [uncultured Thiodictyon sp.]
MLTFKRNLIGGVLVAALALLVGLPLPAAAATGREIDREASAALSKLYREVPAARQLGRRAKGIMIFPSVVKGGLMVGGQYGEGVMRKGRRTLGYYQIAAASYGLQAGVQSFGYALFFMTDSALRYLDQSQGWEIGVGPSVVVIDEGKARTLTTTTMKDDIYAFVFGQQGLMAGMGIQGSKITRIQPGK